MSSVNPTFLTFPIEALRGLAVSDPELIRRNKRQARARLKDQFPEYALQTEVLAAALEADAPVSLMAAAERRALPIESGRLAQMLVSRFGFQEYMARWSVAAWAFALGLMDEEAVSSTLTINEPATGPERAEQALAPSGAETLGDGTVPPAAGTGGGIQPPDTGTPKQPDSARPSPRTGGPGGASRNMIIAGLAVLVVIVGSIIGVTMIHAFGPHATPTPTAIPTPTPTATPTSVPTATPVPTVDTAAVESHDVSTILAHGYNAKSQIPEFAFTPDGSGGTLYAWAAICANSGDGYCAKVFFFHGQSLLGTDTSGNSLAINSVESAGPKVIDVTYANYKASDPNCCPSGVPVTISYTWNGSSMSASGTPPGH